AFSLRDTSTANRIANGQLILSNVVTAETPAQSHAGQNGGTFDPGTYNLTASVRSGVGHFELLRTNPPNAGPVDWTPSATSEARTGGLSPLTGDILTKAGAAVTPPTYRGAVDPNGPKWYEGWVNYADN